MNPIRVESDESSDECDHFVIESNWNCRRVTKVVGSAAAVGTLSAVAGAVITPQMSYFGPIFLGLSIGTITAIGFDALPYPSYIKVGNALSILSAPLLDGLSNFFKSAGCPWNNGIGSWKPIWSYPPNGMVRQIALCVFPAASAVVIGNALHSSRYVESIKRVNLLRNPVKYTIYSASRLSKGTASIWERNAFLVIQISKLALGGLCVGIGYQSSVPPLVFGGFYLLGDSLGTFAELAHAQHLLPKKFETCCGFDSISPQVKLALNIITHVVVGAAFSFPHEGAMFVAGFAGGVCDFSLLRRLEIKHEEKEEATDAQLKTHRIRHIANGAFYTIKCGWFAIGTIDPTNHVGEVIGIVVAVASYPIGYIATVKGMQKVSHKSHPFKRWLYYKFIGNTANLANIYFILRSLQAVGSESFGEGSFAAAWDIAALGVLGIAISNGQALMTLSNDENLTVATYPIMQGSYNIGLSAFNQII